MVSIDYTDYFLVDIFGGLAGLPMRYKVAYVMSRFPKITETFILYELLSVAENDIEVGIYPLMRERTKVMHPEAKSLMSSVYFTPLISVSILLSNIRLIFNRPRLYFDTLFFSLKANWGSRRFFLGIIVFYLKSVYLAQLMTKNGVTHLHAHFASFPAATAFIINKLCGIPYSFTAHGSDLHRDRHMLCEKVKNASFVVAVSDYNKRVILSHCGDQFSEKLFLVHCGVDTSKFSRSEKLRKDYSAEPIKIVCTGTLHEVKGQKYLLEAGALLNHRGVNFIMEFVGNGPDEKDLYETVKKKNLGDKVIFHGRLVREEIVQLLCRTDIFVLPSVPTDDGRREGIPVALMEAMSVGVAVVSSDLSGIPELVDDEINGLLVQPRDIIGLADKIERLIKDSDLRRRLSDSGRQKILREFDLKVNSKKLSELFKAQSICP